MPNEGAAIRRAARTGVMGRPVMRHVRVIARRFDVSAQAMSASGGIADITK